MLEEKRKGDLSDSEIENYMERFVEMVHIQALARHNQYHRRFDLHGIISAGFEAVWKSLLAYRHDGGMPLAQWVRTWTWKLIGRHCRQELKRHLQRGKFNHEWPVNSNGEQEDFATTENVDDAVNIERADTAERLKNIAMSELKEKDREIFLMYFVQGMSNSKIAMLLAVTHQSVTCRVQNVIEQVRRLVANRPEFNHVREKDIELRGNDLPRFRRVAVPGRHKKMSEDAFRWVDTAAA